jgi:hypothetical protein
MRRWFKNAYFHELYDMQTDHRQMHNIYEQVGDAVQADLQGRLERVFACRGLSCA